MIKICLSWCARYFQTNATVSFRLHRSFVVIVVDVSRLVSFDGGIGIIVVRLSIPPVEAALFSNLLFIRSSSVRMEFLSKA